jgi:hypothetical protein
MAISDKQLDANRRNAQLSTGPRTPEGKARSAMNGFTNSFTGLTEVMTREDALARQVFIKDYIADWAPQGAIERQMATTLALDNWRLNRIKSVEENIFAWGQLVNPGVRVESEFEKIENALTHANSYLVHADRINQISLYESRLNRAIAGNTRLLLARQAERRRNQPVAEHEPKAETEEIQYFTAGNGFASAIPQTPAATTDPAPETIPIAA